jgi:hypothetical protein
LAALDRLQQLQIYPVLLFVKFKNVQQLKDVHAYISGSRPSKKQAKEMLDAAQQSHAQLITMNCAHTIGKRAGSGACTHHARAVSVPSQSNITETVQHLCEHIDSAVEHEQKKTIWVPCSEPL